MTKDARERAHEIFGSCAASVRESLPDGAVLWDAHTHLGNDIDGMVGRPRELLDLLAPYGFSGAFTFCLDEPDRVPAFSAANDRTLAYAEGEDTLVPFVRLDLDDSPVEEAVRCLDLGARGIKLHPRAQKFSVGDRRLEPVFELAVERNVPILIHGGRGLPPIADALAALVERYPDTRLIIAHAGIADMAALAGHFSGVPGVYFDTSVWSAVDVLDVFRQVSPEQVIFATDYPYGRPLNGLLLALRAARLSGLDADQVRGLVGGTAAGIAAGAPPPALTPPRGLQALSQPLTFARISGYIAMSAPMLWARQPDAAMGLGLAVNAALEEHDDVEEAAVIRDALVTAAEIWGGLPEISDELERRQVGDDAKWLVHVAGVLAATTIA